VSSSQNSTLCHIFILIYILKIYILNEFYLECTDRVAVNKLSKNLPFFKTKGVESI
jgi:hypothetical protein